MSENRHFPTTIQRSAKQSLLVHCCNLHNFTVTQCARDLRKNALFLPSFSLLFRLKGKGDLYFLPGFIGEK